MSANFRRWILLSLAGAAIVAAFGVAGYRREVREYSCAHTQSTRRVEQRTYFFLFPGRASITTQRGPLDIEQSANDWRLQSIYVQSGVGGILGNKSRIIDSVPLPVRAEHVANGN